MATLYHQPALVVVVIYGDVLGSYAVLAGRARWVFGSPRAVRIMNRAGGTVTAAA